MEFNFEKESKKPLIKKIIIESIIWIVQIVLVVSLAYVIVHFTMERTSMIGDSMEATLYNQDKIVINKFAYRFTEPKRFDVVVFKQEDKEHSFYNIKRIIGLPGETVEIVDGVVYVNGSILSEPINIDKMNNSGLAGEEISLDENEYFVLGDNRNNSEDSRFANIGNILKDDIVGKAWIKINKFNFIDKMNLKKEVE